MSILNRYKNLRIKQEKYNTIKIITISNFFHIINKKTIGK